MKNIYTLMGAALIGLASCSSEDLTPADVVVGDPSTATCLLDSYTYEDADGDDNMKVDFSYNESSFLTNITEIEVHENETYRDSLIFEVDSEGRVVKRYWAGEDFVSEYTYESGKITQINSSEWTDSQGNTYSWAWKYDYLVNDKNQVTEIRSFYMENDEWIEDSDVYYFTWTDGNLTKVENWDTFSASNARIIKPTLKQLLSSPQKARTYHIAKIEALANARTAEEEFQKYSETTMQYDDQFNPFKPLPSAYNIWDFEFITASNNNIVETSYSTVDGTYSSNETYDYTYTDEGYPAVAEGAYNSEYNYNGEIDTYESTYTIEFTYICE